MNKSNLVTALIASAYILIIVLSNLAFDVLPMVQTPLGATPIMSFFVGIIFIFRDLAQRRVGHKKIIPLMLLGVVLTWLTVKPALAIASVSAFAVSEFVDWAVYTWTKKSFEDRVLISSSIAIPLDSLVFLGLMGFLSVGSFIVMFASKMLLTVLLWAVWKKYNIEGIAYKITN